MAASNQTKMNPFTKKAYSANFFTLRDAAKLLPVSQNLPELLSTIDQHNVVVLVGEAGSGKTTQLPKAILQADAARQTPTGVKLALTQNRRLAAQLVADRIAEEMDVPLGEAVGLRYRGRDLRKSTTRLEVVTDGTLLAAARSDKTLNAYGVIIIDEAHQHTCATDLLLGLLKELAETRKQDLKIIIMSATIDADLFTNFFPGSVCATVSGREHKVDVRYLEKQPTRVRDAIVDTIVYVHLTQQSGNILVFASGVREIHEIISGVQNAIKNRFERKDMGPLSYWPLYAQLPADEQDNAVESVAPAPSNGKPGRKLIVATNIAETSITLTGVTHVIDSCRVKSKV
ncbi:MAG: hypothetical protein Q9227_008240 [Pyrenula ochraceoflavens]